ncbi:hypothetical protein [Comamonas testosteroni]
MTPAEQVAQHPALAEFCVQEVLAQMASPLSPEQIRAALEPETENQYEAI